MKIILKLFFITSFTLNKFNCINDYCKKVCDYDRRCSKLCENFSSDSRRSSVELPNCGLIDFNNKNECKIVNGTEAEKNKYPWIVSIQVFIRKDNNKAVKLQTCSGAIINSWFILTASQCVDWTPK
jgi:hypothetical protein